MRKVRREGRALVRARVRVRVYLIQPTHAAGVWKAAFQRLCTLERRVEVDELLHSFGLPLQIREGVVESDPDRERRLARALLSNLQLSVWADGTPICNRSFQAHTFSFMCALATMPPRHLCLGSGGAGARAGAERAPAAGSCDDRIFEASDAAKKAARRPQLWILIRKGDSLSELAHVLRARVEDTQTLNTATLVRGMAVRVRVRWIKGDLPLLQRCLGIHSSGSARFRCPFCKAGVEMCAALGAPAFPSPKPKNCKTQK